MTSDSRFDTIEQRRSRQERRAEMYAHVIARFRTEFGRERVYFELLDYEDSIGICVESSAPEEDDFRRIALRFDRRDSLDVVDRAVAYVKDWAAGKTEYKGVPGDHVLEGNEMLAREIAA